MQNGTTNSYGKTEESVCFESFPITPNKFHRRVGLTDEIGIPIFSHYLCFSVKVRTNKRVYFFSKIFVGIIIKLYYYEILWIIIN